MNDFEDLHGERNALHQAVAVTVQRSRNADAHSLVSGADSDNPGAAAGPGTITTAGIDGGGNPITVHPFILDLDSMDDPGAVMV